MGMVEKVDARSGHRSTGRKTLKKKKIRTERQRAKKNPETSPAYGRNRGYQT